MARALDVLRTAGRIVWLCTGIGYLVYVVKRRLWMYRTASQEPYKPGDITYTPEPDTAGLSEADKAEALRRKLGGGP
jgi:hypothetical protein